MKLSRKIPLRNKFENRIAQQLKEAGVKYEYERSRLPYVIEGRYIPDFTIRRGRSVWFLEAKGYLRPEARRKMAAVRKAHPDADIRLVFYSGPDTKQGKSYAKWAEKNGFRYCFRDIPEEWLN